MSSAANPTMVLLVDTDSNMDGAARKWLEENGYVSWLAHDVCQLFEELSDFTVRTHPDVVLMAVSSLPECFEALQHSIRLSANKSDLKVVGLCGKRNKLSRRRYFASDLDQLQTIMHREVPCVSQ
jgi:DNA-binding response OmpR family regulator